MIEGLQYQIRIYFDDAAAAVARTLPDDPSLAPLPEILRRHSAVMKCQYDAFAGYVADAERNGTADYPLYKWTKATIDHPGRKQKYLMGASASSSNSAARAPTSFSKTPIWPPLSTALLGRSSITRARPASPAPGCCCTRR